MPKWKKDATEFTVGVNLNGVRGYQATVPKPVMEALGEPETITYSLKGKKVEVKSGESNETRASSQMPHARSASSLSSER